MIGVLNINIEDLINNHEVCAITTNGCLNIGGECIMGRGVAKIAKDLYPEFSYVLGLAIERLGNHVHWFSQYRLFSFPTKHNWWEKSNIKLIERSTQELGEKIDKYRIERVYLPKPGCSNGGLKWKNVERVIEPIIHKNIVVIDKL